MSAHPEVSIVMPTLALAERRSLIRRACDSALEQEDVAVTLIAVVNGPGRDEEVVEDLRSRDPVRVEVLEEPDLPASHLAGRRLVDTPWFGHMDDDDVLLPGALARRVGALRDDPESLVAVDNGIVRTADGDQPVMEDVDAVRRAPLEALTRGNWLLPGSWLARSEAVGPELIEGMPRHLECTYLAARFALAGPIRFLERPGVVWHKHLWPSVSSGRHYKMGQSGALERILELDLPADVRRAFREQLRESRHVAAELHRQEGEVGRAWRSHLRSLVSPGGWRYLPYTWKLLSPLGDAQEATDG